MTRSPATTVVESLTRVELALDRLNRHLAGDFAGGVAAHAVGDDEQPAVAARVDGEVVLVPGPDHADVGPGGVKQAHH